MFPCGAEDPGATIVCSPEIAGAITSSVNELTAHSPTRSMPAVWARPRVLGPRGRIGITVAPESSPPPFLELLNSSTGKDHKRGGRDA